MKIVISILIFLNLSCKTTRSIVYSVQEKKEYFPYEGTFYDFALIALGPSWTIFGQQGSFGDSWSSFVLDTILLPGTLPYYIYVKSGRPRSEDWYYEKRNENIYIFRTQNSSYDVLRSIVWKKSNCFTKIFRVLRRRGFGKKSNNYKKRIFFLMNMHISKLI